MNGQAIRRPEWEGCPNFGRMWSALFGMYAMTGSNSHADAQGAIRVFCGKLADARVVKVDYDYLWDVADALQAHLPEDPSAGQVRITELVEAGIWAFADSLPFDPLWIEFASPRDGGLTGLLWMRDEVAVGLKGDGPRQWDVVTLPLYDGEDVVAPFLWDTTSSVEHPACIRVPLFADDNWDDEDTAHEATTISTLGNALLSLLRSSNVGLDNDPVSRQVRRAAERSGRSIPLTIHVRRSSKASQPRGGKAHYSHSFERRGSFQHHERGPIFENCKDPAKRFMRNGVECVRVWSPPCVVGDGPFIPKVRAIVPELVA